ncbi:hypothetical protein PCE1_002425 [Barthelona sp. PCE]
MFSLSFSDTQALPDEEFCISSVDLLRFFSVMSWDNRVLFSLANDKNATSHLFSVIQGSTIDFKFMHINDLTHDCASVLSPPYAILNEHEQYYASCVKRCIYIRDSLKLNSLINEVAPAIALPQHLKVRFLSWAKSAPMLAIVTRTNLQIHSVLFGIVYETELSTAPLQAEWTENRFFLLCKRSLIILEERNKRLVAQEIPIPESRRFIVDERDSCVHVACDTRLLASSPRKLRYASISDDIQQSISVLAEHSSFPQLLRISFGGNVTYIDDLVMETEHPLIIPHVFFKVGNDFLIASHTVSRAFYIRDKHVYAFDLSGQHILSCFEHDGFFYAVHSRNAHSTMLSGTKFTGLAVSRLNVSFITNDSNEIGEKPLLQLSPDLEEKENHVYIMNQFLKQISDQMGTIVKRHHS